MTVDGRYLRGVHEAKDKDHLAQLCEEHRYSLVWWKDMSAPAAKQRRKLSKPTLPEATQEPSLTIPIVPGQLEPITREEIPPFPTEKSRWKIPDHLSPRARIICGVLCIGGLFNIWRLHQRPVQTHLSTARLQAMEDLRQVGFYSHVPPDKLEEVLAQDRLYASPLRSRGSGRLFLLSEREWKPGAVTRILKDLSPFLVKEGWLEIPVRKLTSSEEPDSYKIALADLPVTLFTAQERKDGSFVDLAPRRLLRTINKLLDQKNSKERAYWQPNAAESTVIFLTREQFALLERSSAREAWSMLQEP